jgi:hypothetical protein
MRGVLVALALMACTSASADTLDIPDCYRFSPEFNFLAQMAMAGAVLPSDLDPNQPNFSTHAMWQGVYGMLSVLPRDVSPLQVPGIASLFEVQALSYCIKTVILFKDNK